VDLSKFEWIDWDPEDDEDGNTPTADALASLSR
jgi:hypothetical protein